MPSEDIKILEFNQYRKSDKAPFIIYADLKYLIVKIDVCKTNPESLDKWTYSARFFNVYNSIICIQR